MAKATPIDSGKVVFTGLKYMYVTPWEKQEDGSFELSDSTYEIVNIVGDTTSLEQEDNETTAIEHEFSGTPLYEAVTLGSRTFTAECADYQKDVLQKLFGWEVAGSGESEVVYAPSGYETFFAAIELGFNSTDQVVVLPKVRLDSKVTLASMKTDIGRATISGTAYQAYAKVGTGNVFKTDMFITKESIGDDTAGYKLSESETIS